MTCLAILHRAIHQAPPLRLAFPEIRSLPTLTLLWFYDSVWVLAWRLQCWRELQPFLTTLCSSTRRVLRVISLLLGPLKFCSKGQIFFHFTHDRSPHKRHPLYQGHCVTIKQYNIGLRKADLLHQCQKLSLSFWVSSYPTTLPETQVCYGIPPLQHIILPCGSAGIFHPLALAAVSVGSVACLIYTCCWCRFPGGIGVKQYFLLRDTCFNRLCTPPVVVLLVWLLPKQLLMVRL